MLFFQIAIFTKWYFISKHLYKIFDKIYHGDKMKITKYEILFRKYLKKHNPEKYIELMSLLKNE